MIALKLTLLVLFLLAIGVLGYYVQRTLRDPASPPPPDWLLPVVVAVAIVVAIIAGLLSRIKPTHPEGKVLPIIPPPDHALDAHTEAERVNEVMEHGGDPVVRTDWTENEVAAHGAVLFDPGKEPDDAD